MEKQLPKNWVECKLGELATVQSGGTPSRGINSYWNGDIPWVKISDIKEMYVDKTTEFITEEGLKNSSTRIFPKGTILFTIFATLGKIGILNIDAATNQAIAGITPSNFIDDKYLTYSLINLSNSISEYGKGVAQKNINQAILKDTIIPLPPLQEQSRIVEKLDNMFYQLETIKASMANIPLLLKDFRQQVLSQAVTGKLTEEWRVGKELEEWKYEFAKDCCEKVQSGGTPKGSNFATSGIPFLKVYNIVNNKIDFEYNPQYVSDKIQNSQIKKSITFPDDVIMNIVGPPLNKIAIIPDDYPEWNLNQAITLFRVKDYLSNKFLYYFFCRGSSVKSLVNETKGVVGQVNISLSQCRDFSIPIPSIKEQQEIVSRIESLFAKADIIEKQYKTLKQKIEDLPQAILHKAFKGELVEQLESDGDAKELLAAIQKLKAGVAKVVQRKATTNKVKTYSENAAIFGMVAEPK